MKIMPGMRLNIRDTFDIKDGKLLTAEKIPGGCSVRWSGEGNQPYYVKPEEERTNEEPRWKEFQNICWRDEAMAKLTFGVNKRWVSEDYEDAVTGNFAFMTDYGFVECNQDREWEFGNKHAEPGKFEGPQSIIRYEDYMTAGDGTFEARSMTVNVCFDFCSRFEFAQFFGLREGNRCYCSTGYVARGGTNECNAPCQGDSNQVCGSAHGDASSLYAMFDREKPEPFTKNELEKSKEAIDGLRNAVKKMTTCEDDMFGVVHRITKAANGAGISVSAVKNALMTQRMVLKKTRQ